MNATTAPERGNGVVLGLAAATFAAGLLAVAQHANTTSAGYQLAVAQRENQVLSRMAAQVELRVTSLSTAQAAMARVTSMKLSTLTWPKSWNVVRTETLATCAASPPTPASFTGRKLGDAR